MPKIIYLIIPVLLIIIAVIVYNQYLSSHPQSELPQITVNLKGHKYLFEVASTNPQKAKGLSGRTTLCPYCGMIFVFDTEGQYPFWMKDTLIPLDMLWLDQNGRIVTIVTAQPQPGAQIFQLRNYANTAPARYVVELNAGDAQKIGLKEGDSIDISPLYAAK